MSNSSRKKTCRLNPPTQTISMPDPSSLPACDKVSVGMTLSYKTHGLISLTRQLGSAAAVIGSTVWAFMIASIPVHLETNVGFAVGIWLADRTSTIYMESTKAGPFSLGCLCILFVQFLTTTECFTCLGNRVTLPFDSKRPTIMISLDCHASTSRLCYYFILVVGVWIGLKWGNRNFWLHLRFWPIFPHH
jgi:hypothetical protein